MSPVWSPSLWFPPIAFGLCLSIPTRLPSHLHPSLPPLPPSLLPPGVLRLVLWGPSNGTSPLLFPALSPVRTSPSFDLSPSCCSSASSSLRRVSSFLSWPFSSLLFQSFSFFPCVLLCASFSVRLSLHLSPPSSLSLGVCPFSFAHRLRVSPLGLLPPALPSLLGERPSGCRVPTPSRPRAVRGGGGGVARGRPSRFLSSSLPHIPPPPGPQPTPPPLRPRRAPGARGCRGCGEGAPGAGPRSYFAKRRGGPRGRAGCGPLDGTELGAHPGPRRRCRRLAPAAHRVGAYLGARCPPPAARARPGRAAHTSANARPPRPCSLRAGPGRAGRAGVRGARTPPTGRSPSAPSCWLHRHRLGSQPPSRRG